MTLALDSTLSEPPDERLWTRAEYYRLTEDGFFDGQRVELIEGRIYRMPPQGLPHTCGVELVTEFFHRAFGKGHRYRVQMPFRAADGSDPEPDVLVVAGSPRDPADGHPTTALIVVEVSDTTLRHDRRKAKLYAASGVKDYWILNLLEEVLEVYREPVASPTDETSAYGSVQILKRDQVIAPLAAPSVSVKVADLLP